MASLDFEQNEFFFWGRPTSTLDWCEENYALLPFIAEFWNTISNLAIVVPCLIGLYNCHRLKLGWHFAVPFLGLLGVGIGSWLFHMTLLWHYQLVDELSMIYASCIFVFGIVDSRYTTGIHGITLASVLSAYAVFVTLYYIYSKNVIFHQTAYGVQVAGIILLSYLKSRKAPSRVRALFYIAVGAYITAFALWNVDNQLCGQLQLLRAYLGIFAPIIELHAWWHIGVGIGSYLYIIFSIVIRLQELNHEVALATIGGLPIIGKYSKSAEKSS